MVLRRISPSTSNLFHDVIDFAVPSVPFRYVSQGQDGLSYPISFGHNNATNSTDDHAHTSSVSLPFSPWIFEVSPSASPLSRSSSLSGSEYVSTPPQYIEQRPIHNMLDPLLPLPTSYAARSSDFANNQELTWQPHLPEEQMSSSQQSLSQLPLLWNPTNYGDLPQPSAAYYAQPLPGRVTCLATADQPVIQFRDSAPLKSLETDSVTTGSDSDSDGSDSEDDSSTFSKCGRSGSENNDASTTGFLNLGKWSMVVDSFGQPPQRHYVCPEYGRPDAHGRRCDGTFIRPEHLRRHVKTVHGEERPFRCKVPQCERPFSRGDNLRDHYWTHIHRGGRIGKNDKMGLSQLNVILGPKEKALKRKLRRRLAAWQNKQRNKAKL
jgi:hypothetical protein